MELAGTAADIADASSPHAAQGPSTAAQSDAGADKVAMYPLNLFGWVGEGAPCDAMAEEALRLWGGVSRTPPDSWGGALPPERPELEGLQPSDSSRDIFRTGMRPAMMDVPVLKAIFCASDAIRLQLAQSLLSVCAGSGSVGGGGGMAGDDHATTSPGKDDDPLVDGNGEGATPLEGGPSPSTAVTAAPSDATSSSDGTQKNSVAVLNPSAGHEPGLDADPMRAVPASDDLREHVVRLLLDNIPRAAKPGGGQSGEGRQQQEREWGVAAAGTAGGRQQRGGRRKDCTQLFDVLCVLVEGSIKAAASGRPAGGSTGGGARGPGDGRLDVDALAANVVERLLAHPCTERRGAKEADKDTLLVRDPYIYIERKKLPPLSLRIQKHVLGGKRVQNCVL